MATKLRTVGEIINEPAPTGHNNPPEPTPFEASRERITELEAEAQNWFDGEPIANEAQAADVSRLLDEARKSAKEADGHRKVEKQPHADAAKAVDDRWKPVIASAERVAEVAKGVLTPWLMKLEREKREREDAARREAEAKAAEARRLAEANDGTLAAAKARDAAIEEAETAQRLAAQAAADKAGAKGAGMARTVALRTIWRSAVEDRRALLNHVARTRADDLDEFLEQWAARAVREGAREIPGVRVYEEKAAA